MRGKLVATFETPEQFSGMELNDKGTRLATMVRGSNLIEVFEIKSGESLGRVKAPKHGPFFLNPKGDIVLFSADSSLFLYHLKNEKLKEVHTKMKLQNMKLIDRGKLLVIADDQGRIEFRKTSNGKRVGKPLHHASPAWVASHSKKARLVATRCNNGGAKLTSHLWDRKKAKVVEDFVGIGPTFSQDDRVFAYTEQDRKGYHTLVAKELSDGQELFRIKPEKGKRQPFLITIHNSKKSLGIWTSDFGKNGWENVRFRKVPRPQKEQ